MPGMWLKSAMSFHLGGVEVCRRGQNSTMPASNTTDASICSCSACASTGSIQPEAHLFIVFNQNWIAPSFLT